MTRSEFVKMCGLLGIGTPVLIKCGSSKKENKLKSSGKVIIIGAGAAGLSTAYLLYQKGIDFIILEAGNTYGGRMKRTLDFTDFPIPLGAEWLHTQKRVFKEIVNNTSIDVKVTTTPYDFKIDKALLDEKEVSLKKLGFSIDQKFINSTWFDFFDEYVVPPIKDKIQLNKAVKSINYKGDKVVVETSDQIFKANKVVVTVPVKILQDKLIQFIPDLPNKKKAAIDKVTVWDGCKVFIEFSRKFYPVVTGFKVKPETLGHKLFYDAAYGQDSRHHIMGLFAVGQAAHPYLQLPKEDLIDYILEELDQIFNGQASETYVKHIFQNWSSEEHIKGAYVYYYEDWRRIRTLAKPVDDKLYFAGDAYTDGSSWSSVHAAAHSSKSVVKQLIS